MFFLFLVPRYHKKIRLITDCNGRVGTFHIDPYTPAPLGEGPTIHTRHGRWKKGKGKKKKGVVHSGPHASFQTRSGDMKLHLGSTLSTDATSTRGEREREERANIFIGTRKGKVEVTLVSSAITPVLFSGRWTAFVSEFEGWSDAPIKFCVSLPLGAKFLSFLSFEFHDHHGLAF
jgi:hypothetical protein